MERENNKTYDHSQPKSYGPFKIPVPKLDDEDMYKFMVHTLLKNNFTLLSAQTITAIGREIISHNKQFFKDYKMGALKLETFCLNSVLSKNMAIILVP